MTTAFIQIISAVLLPIYFLLHYYLSVRISAGFGFKGIAKWTMEGVFVSLAVLSTPAALETTHSFIESSGTAYHYAAFSWLGIVGIVSVIFLFIDSIRVLLRIAARLSPLRASMAVSLALKLEGKSWTIGALLFSLAISAYGIFEAIRSPVVKTVNIEIPGLQRNLTIVQLNDLHLGPVFGVGRIGTIMTAVRRINPDLLALVGDIIDADIKAEQVKEYIDSISSFRGRWNTIAVLGNNEEYFGIDAIADLFRGAGIKLLRDTLITLNEEVQVAGVDDYGLARDLSNRRRLNAVIEGRQSKLPLVLLGHDPTFFEEEAETGVALQLAGHTHGGQVFPLQIFAKMKFNFVSGLYTLRNSSLYVSNGSGTKGPLLRLFARPEISVIDLRGTHNQP
jgi:predicted MPP superfamily phosphohydrolase